MHPIPAEHERSLRRSRLRLQTLLTLSSLGEGYVGQIARLAGFPPSRVTYALLGKHPRYRVDLSLVSLGLAQEERRGRSRVFVITTAGRRKARSIARAMAKRGRYG